MVDTLEPPPRLTGIPQNDTIALREWCWALYNNFVLGQGVLTSQVLAHGLIYIGDTSGKAAQKSLSGDATISDAGALTLATACASPGSYGDGTHVASITVNAKGQVTAASNTAITLSTSSLALATNHILVGDGSNFAADVAMSGDATIASSGAITVTKSGGAVFGSAAFSSSSAFASSSLTNTHILVGNGSGVAVDVAVSGDVTIANTGVVTIANDVVTFAKFQNITDVRLLGRSAGSAGDMQEITVGSGLTLSAGALTASGTGGSGDVNPFSDGGITKPAAANFTISDDTTVGHGTGTAIDLSSRGVEFVQTIGANATTQSLYSKTAVSSTLVSVIAYIAPNFGGVNGKSFFYGLAVRDNTGKIDAFGLTFDAGVGNTVHYHATFTNISTAPTLTAFNGGHMICGRPCWMKLEKISTNFVFSVSSNGETYDVIATVSATGFIGATINDVGFVLYNALPNGSKIVKLDCFHFAHL